MTIKVLFVCLGNICRSPMAEAIFQQLVEEAGLTDHFLIDSAGTGSWHIGEPAHAGTRRILAKHQISYHGRARQVTTADISTKDTYIIGMDGSNIRDLEKRYGRHPRLFRLLDFASETQEHDVPDPYYTNNFETVYQLVLDGCKGLLVHICQENQIPIHKFE